MRTPRHRMLDIKEAERLAALHGTTRESEITRQAREKGLEHLLLHRYHQRDPLTLPPSTGQQLMTLLSWQLKLNEEGKKKLREASRDVVRTKVHGGDQIREALLQLVHPRHGALIDLLLRSTPEGSVTRAKEIALHSGVNQHTTNALIATAMKSMRHALQQNSAGRRALRKKWGEIAEQGVWPWADSEGAYKPNRVCSQPRRQPVMENVEDYANAIPTGIASRSGFARK